MCTPDRSIIFPSVEFVRHEIDKQGQKTHLPVVLDCMHIFGADYTAAKVVALLIEDFRARNQKLVFYHLQPRVARTFEGVNAHFSVFYERESLEADLTEYNDSKL